MKVLSLLPWLDWLALAFFMAAWIGYAFFARRLAVRRNSLLAATNHFRLRWIRASLTRDPRVLDGIITQTLSHTPSFFSSTTIIIMGGLIALLGTTDKAAEFVKEIPFSQSTPMLVFEFKILILVAIFVYAFFRFSWSMRQYTFVALMIGALPEPSFFRRPARSTRALRPAGGRHDRLGGRNLQRRLACVLFFLRHHGLVFFAPVFCVHHLADRRDFVQA